MNDNIQNKLEYQKELYLAVEIGKDEWNGHGHLFHRQDYNEDGSTTHWYGIELRQSQYELIQQLLSEKDG